MVNYLLWELVGATIETENLEYGNGYGYGNGHGHSYGYK